MRVMRHLPKLAAGLCAVLVAAYLAAPFCPQARAAARGCCDPATGCGAGAGLSAPDCCQLDSGRSGAAQHPAAGTAGLPTPQGRSVSDTDVIDLSARLSADPLTWARPSSTGDPPPLYLLHASLLR